MNNSFSPAFQIAGRKLYQQFMTTELAKLPSKDRLQMVNNVLCGNQESQHPQKYFSHSVLDHFIGIIKWNQVNESNVVIMKTSFYQKIPQNNEFDFAREDIVLIPLFTINHYGLAVVDATNKIIFVYDSIFHPDTQYRNNLESQSGSPMEKFKQELDVLERYISSQTSYGSNWTKKVLLGPAQKNNFDCGVFMLYAIDYLSRQNGTIHLPVCSDIKIGSVIGEYITYYRYFVLFSVLSGRLDLPVQLHDYDNWKASNEASNEQNQILNDPALDRNPDDQSNKNPYNSKTIRDKLNATQFNAGKSQLKKDEMRALLCVHGIRFTSILRTKADLLPLIKKLKENEEHIIDCLKRHLSRDDFVERYKYVQKFWTLTGDEFVSLRNWDSNSNAQTNFDHSRACASKRNCFFSNPIMSADECGKVRCAFCGRAVHCFLCLQKNGGCRDKECLEQQNQARIGSFDFGKNLNSWASHSRISRLFIPEGGLFTPEGNGVLVSNVEYPPPRKRIFDSSSGSSAYAVGLSANKPDCPEFDESPPKSDGSVPLSPENRLSVSQPVSSVKKRKRDRSSNSVACSSPCGSKADEGSSDLSSDDDEFVYSPTYDTDSEPTFHLKLGQVCDVQLKHSSPKQFIKSTFVGWTTNEQPFFQPFEPRKFLNPMFPYKPNDDTSIKIDGKMFERKNWTYRN